MWLPLNEWIAVQMVRLLIRGARALHWTAMVTVLREVIDEE